MTEYAPQPIKDLFATIKTAYPSAIMAGIVGDSAHGYGYHRGRNYCSGSSDYSCQTPPDQKGDGEAACALDLSWGNASDQYALSKRLLDLKNDARVTKAVRSFFGSTDGRSVCGWDYYYQNPSTSDDSHLWHVHMSFLRQYATDAAALRAVGEAITGKPATGGGDDMPKQIYLYTKSGQKTKIAKHGTWQCVGWDADLDNTGGYSLTLPKGATLFSMSAWLSIESGLPVDGNLYWRVQTLRGDTGAEIAKYPSAEQRGTTGGTALCLSQVGSVSAGTQTNLRILVASTHDNLVIERAWWRCLYW